MGSAAIQRIMRLRQGGMMLSSLLILTVTMAMIALQKLPGFHHNRPTGALTGAVLMLLAGQLTLDQALAAVDLTTLGLLFGLMVIVAYLEESGALARLGAAIAHIARGRALVWTVLFTSGLLAALLMNDTVCLLLAPVILDACRRQGIDALPPLIALILGANIGSLMLPIGNPQQAFIMMHADIAFADYARHMIPIALACLGIAGLLLHLVHRRPAAGDPVPEQAAMPLDRPLAWRAGLVLAAMLAAMLAGTNMMLAALTAACVLLLIGRRQPDAMLARINWPLLLMFTGLFVVMAGVRDSGLAGAAFAHLAPLLHGSQAKAVFGLGLFTLVGSNLVSNVPFVMLAAQWMPSYADAHQAWLVLAAASTLAGNLTLVGSVAALIVAEQAERQGLRLGFARFAAIGVPVTLATTALALAWIYAGI